MLLLAVAERRSILTMWTWFMMTGGPISADNADLERTSSCARHPVGLLAVRRNVMVTDMGMAPSPSICTREPERNQGASQSTARGRDGALSAGAAAAIEVVCACAGLPAASHTTPATAAALALCAFVLT
ncbi:hypothetical protein CF70_033335 [Cupriavidus sp. SK-3]|nr:hypothetical protein CF70_033335 [Cupriavidus sp. SK-3]